MKVEFYGHVRQYRNIQSEIDHNIKTVIESGQYVLGPMLKRFEGELATYHGTKYAIGLGNGTDAIWLALMALGFKQIEAHDSVRAAQAVLGAEATVESLVRACLKKGA